MRSLRRLVASTALAGVLAAAATGCGGDDDEGDDPIRVGSIFTVAGGIDYSAAPAGAEAYFEWLNENEGGIDGRRVELLREDDRNDPSEAAAAARRMLGDEIVAMVGGNSAVDCAANDELYRSRDITSFISLGSNPSCFASPNQVPIQKGGIAATIQSARILVEEKGKENVVLITFDAPTGRSAGEVVEGFLQSRDALGGPSEYVSPGADPTASIARVARRNPDGIVVLATFPVSVAIIEALSAQGLAADDGVDIGAVLTFYQDETPEIVGEAGDGITLPTDFLPPQVADEPQEMEDWKAAMNEFVPDQRLGAEAQAGWIAAQLFTEVVRSIDGEITPEAVTEAFRSTEEYENDMLACPVSPAEFQGGILHRCDYVVELRDGEWRPLDELGVLEFPPEGFELPPPPEQE